jgi:hypothetical protein
VLEDEHLQRRHHESLRRHALDEGRLGRRGVGAEVVGNGLPPVRQLAREGRALVESCEPVLP